ncbi:MAG: hypothetical protein RL488_847 [Actinomycetota bacterium]
MLSIGVALTLAGCSSPAPTPTSSADPTPSIAASLIPTAPPSDVVDVDPALFAGDFGDYTFRVGDGPTWCTINNIRMNVLCEQSEADAKYPPIPVPSSCEFSYGYQVQLFATQPEDGSKIADFVCSGGAYADPTSAYVLNSGERLTLDGISCFVEGTAARCENEAHNYIVLGPDAWAIGS